MNGTFNRVWTWTNESRSKWAVIIDTEGDDGWATDDNSRQEARQ